MSAARPSPLTLTAFVIAAIVLYAAAAAPILNLAAQVAA